MNRNWPTLDKSQAFVGQEGAYWITPSGERFLDCFSDVGGSPISNDLLNDWVQRGISEGIAIRKPHVYRDERRDGLYPEFIGERLRLSDPSVFYSNSGTEAIEAAIKLARRATGRTAIVGIQGDFHGRTYGALSLSKSTPHYHFDGFGPFVPDIYCIDEDEAEFTSALNVAALVVSPINGNNVVEDWTPWVWEFARRVRNAGGLIVYDEVQTGFGRAGGSVTILQAAEYEHLLRPDIWVFGKGAAAGWPFSVTICEAELADTMQRGSHFNTMAGSPMGCYLSQHYVELLECGALDAALSTVAELADYAGKFAMRRGLMLGLYVADPHAFVELGRLHKLAMMPTHFNKPIRFSTQVVLSESERADLLERFAALMQAAGLASR